MHFYRFKKDQNDTNTKTYKRLYSISSCLNIKKRQRNTDPIFDNTCKCCLVAGFSDSDFTGNSGVVAATQGYDRWVVFQR